MGRYADSMAKQRNTPCISRRLSDGALLEMVFRSETQQTTFILEQNGSTTEHASWQLSDNQILKPYAPTNNLLTHKVVLFPEHAAPFGTSAELAERIQSFIHRYVDVSPSFEAIATYYILFTWVYDAFNEVPYLRVRGDYGSGKSRFLLTAGSLCYKPIFASGASTTSPLFRLLDAVQGTLIIDESDFRVSDEKAEIIKILNNGNARGFPVLRSESTPQREFNPRAFHVFGPKVIATRKLFEDRALESRCITEDMDGRTVRPDIPLNLPEDFEVEAQALRNQLLAYRFRHLRSVGTIDAPSRFGLSPRLAQIFGPLLSLAPDDSVREAMLSRARGTSRVLADERALSVEAEVLASIARLLNISSTVPLKNIAALITNRGEYGDVSSRWVGTVLRKQLGIVPVKSDGTFVIPKRDLPRVRSLFEKYGVEHRDTREQGAAPHAA